MKKSRKAKANISGPGRLMTGGLIAVFAVIVILVLVFQKKVDSMRVSGGLFNYFGERLMEYPGTCTLKYSDDRVTLKDSNGTHDMDSTPLYKEDGSILLPYAYVWDDFANTHLSRLEHFSTVSQEGGSIVLRDGSLKTEDAKGFLHDGIDTYIFLEHVTITAGDETAELPPMSYVVARYGNTLQYYSPATGKSTVIQTGEGDMTATFASGDVLNMGTDTLDCADGTWQLMVVRPQALERMK